jgi:hypothetical protein
MAIPHMASIYVRSSIKLLRLVPFGQQTWPLLLKIEHMVKLHVFGNNSKIVNNITKFGSILPSSFREEDFFNISQSETRIALGSHICRRMGRNEEMISTARSNYPAILK